MSKLIAKTPIGYGGHIISKGENVREYITDTEYIGLLLENGHVEEIDELEEENVASEEEEAGVDPGEEVAAAAEGEEATPVEAGKKDEKRSRRNEKL